MKIQQHFECLWREIPDGVRPQPGTAPFNQLRDVFFAGALAGHYEKTCARELEDWAARINKQHHPVERVH